MPNSAAAIDSIAVAALRSAAAAPTLKALRAEVRALGADAAVAGVVPAGALDQILAARTLARAKHYVGRLLAALTEPRPAPFSDLNLNRWKEVPEILTDSLWRIDARDRSGRHVGDYWGNFVPQIPHQLMRRFTRPGEWVIDPFCGSGTTLIECRRLGRHGLGVELNARVARRTRERVASQDNPAGVTTQLHRGDAATADYRALLKRAGGDSAALALLHPPYHDIIRFSDDARDLSNAPDTGAFLDALVKVAAGVVAALRPGGHVALVIGDKYTGGEWLPLGFWSMQRLCDAGLKLKAVIVKDFTTTTAKRGQEELWRYRALASGLYVFKHEYVFLLQQPGRA